MQQKQIEIEKMMFGDYRVQAWDENLESMLDREYFCRGLGSAMLTAKYVKRDLFPNLPVFIREVDNLREIDIEQVII